MTVYRFRSDPFMYELVNGVYRPLNIVAAQYAQTALREGTLNIVWVGGE